MNCLPEATTTITYCSSPQWCNSVLSSSENRMKAKTAVENPRKRKKERGINRFNQNSSPHSPLNTTTSQASGNTNMTQPELPSSLCVCVCVCVDAIPKNLYPRYAFVLKATYCCCCCFSPKKMKFYPQTILQQLSIKYEQLLSSCCGEKSLQSKNVCVYKHMRTHPPQC